jgi:ketosteroid isomerase-like protein
MERAIMTDTEEINAMRAARALREKNRAALINSVRLLVKWDHSKPSAAAGGYADGKYPDIFTPDGLFETPFSPPEFINVRRGRKEFQFEAEMRYNLFDHYKWNEPFEIHDLLDPNKFILFTTGEGQSKAGAKYSNSYVFFVTMQDGKIAHLRQYFDSRRCGPILTETVEAEPDHDR